MCSQKKVLLICPPFRNTTIRQVEIIEHCGYQVKVLEFHKGINRKNYFLRLCLRAHINIDGTLNRKRIAFNQKAIELFNDYEPDVVLVIQGIQLNEESIEYMKKTATLIVTLSDMLSLFNELNTLVPLYDLVFSYDKSDVEYLNKNGINAKWKKASFNSNIYKKIPCAKDIDISFVGAMYPERRELLNRLTLDLPEYRWAIYGEYAKPRHPILYIKWLTSKNRKYFMNCEIPQNITNEIYNRSKIVLNIVRSNQKMGWSSRLPQILGSGTLQITNYFDAVFDEFNECLVTFNHYEELISKIKYYLENDEKREQVANKGYVKSVNYSDKKAMQYLFSEYEKYITDKTVMKGKK